MADHPSITQLLAAWRGGSQAAFDQLLPIVHRELHQVAHRALRAEPNDPLLQTTALVNEAYLRLVDRHAVDWQGRAHFLAVAARVMRQLLVDAARRRRAAKRGGDATLVLLDNVERPDPAARASHPELIDLDDALTQLQALDQRAARVVELRYFAGMSFDEVAAALAISAITAKRDWRRARAWLFRELDRRAPLAGDGPESAR